MAEHRYAASGTYEVTADIRLADGRRLSLERTVEAESPVALQAGFERGFGDETGAVTLKSVDGAVRAISGPDGRAADLNGGDIVFDVDTPFFGNPEYSVTFDFKKDAGSVGSTARVFKLSANLIVTVVEDAVYVSLITDQTTGRVKAGNLGIDDTDWHSLAFTFSGETGNAILYIDGDEVARETGFKGHSQNGYSTQDLVIGDGFEGAIDNLTFLRGALSAADVKAGRIPEEATPPASGGGGEPVTAPPPVEAPDPAPAPVPPVQAPSRPVADADLAQIAAAIASGDYAGLARDTGRALATGSGSAADEVVLAGSGGRSAAVSQRRRRRADRGRARQLDRGRLGIGRDVWRRGRGRFPLRRPPCLRRRLRRHPRPRFRRGRPDRAERLRGRHVLGLRDPARTCSPAARARS